MWSRHSEDRWIEFILQRLNEVTAMLPSYALGRSPERGTDLPGRLREETMDLHRTLELRMGLPSSVHNRGDYAGLLTRLLAVHSAIETRLDAPAWRGRWRSVGLELIDHERAYLLREDTRNLGMIPGPRAVPAPELTTFEEALGCLYVVEACAVDSRALAPAIQTVLGRVPTSFLDGETRGHPRPWEATLLALRRLEEDDGDCDEVILGARIGFRMFIDHVARSAWTTAT
ncbi:hypothetical protein JF66_03880 [Cryobacterium sp. MLB-32]|uniref:biliverdin-producing heme oxygenase n=1 Tax=Cryobacterium sp. MLB-32 TaxID=1529318 RepID=UPI0004E72FF4|nr:biliverdin-producing heme oxygenase [Cryobacterium sp. MLB-32]KFF60504.1 hypothetical protein JF66_03880 [Cryobacterium sp. MLB-32]